MHERRPSSLYLLIGVLVSLLLHGTVLVPALVAVMESEGFDLEKLRADFQPEDFRKAESDPLEAIELGLEESDASTMTWIGYEEYQRHMAALAEVEQAAFTDTPAGAEPVETVPPAGKPIAETLAEVPEAAETPADAEPSRAIDPFEAIETWLEATVAGEGPPEGEAIDPAAEHRALLDTLDRLEELLTEVAEPPRPRETASRQGEPVPPETRQPAAPSGAPGEVADQQSDPSSTVDFKLEDLTLGRPLAAHGLRLKPRRPKFTPLMMSTSLPANPRAELRFGRDGRVDDVRLLEGSGDPRFDAAIVNSLYGWRAAGRQLETLPRGETIPIRIRILLH